MRIIGGRNVTTGYFRDAEKLISKLSECSLKQTIKQTNIYITLHELHEGCEARLQYENFIDTRKNNVPTTSDNDVTSFRYIPVDLDPVRPAGISSNSKELEEANVVKDYIIAYMVENDFDKYIVAFSGNGYHILFPVDLKVDDQSRDRVKAILNRLDENFSNEFVHVDTTNSNPGRIFKLYGTLAQKGRNAPDIDRPHRMSKILEVKL